MNRTDTILELLCKLARPEILKDFRSDSCIASTKVGIEVLSKFGISARPLSTILEVMNPIYKSLFLAGGYPKSEEEALEWQNKGAWSVYIDDSYLGHVVLIAGTTLVDLSLDQATRPQKGIILHPSVFELNSHFEKSKKGIFYRDVLGCAVRYVALPNNQEFLTSKDWTVSSRTKSIVEAVEGSIKKTLV